MYFYEKMEKLFNEVWRPVKGYEGLYEVSNLGNVRSLDRHVKIGKGYGLLKGKPMKTSTNSHGYLMAMLSKNGQRKQYYIHRLTAEAFIPNPNDLPFIDHINTIRDDNRVENLRWCNAAGNLANPISRKRRIEALKNCVVYPPVIQLDENKNPIRPFKSCRAAAEELGFYTGENIRIAAKRGCKAYGYYWKFEKN